MPGAVIPVRDRAAQVLWPGIGYQMEDSPPLGGTHVDIFAGGPDLDFGQAGDFLAEIAYRALVRYVDHLVILFRNQGFPSRGILPVVFHHPALFGQQRLVGLL